MTTREPPKPATILATPINVEESRAQRLQRQQSRFRDRGGIFVPSSRNTLADILLGKAPPLKKSRRSTSASPLKRKSLGKNSAQPSNLTDIQIPSSKAPAKQSRKSAGGRKEDGGTPAMLSAKIVNKGKSKATADDKNGSTEHSKSSSKAKLKSKPKVEAKKSKLAETEGTTKSTSKIDNAVIKSKPAGKTSVVPLDNNTGSTVRKPNTSNNLVASSSKLPQTTRAVNVKQPAEILSAKPPLKKRKSLLYSSGGSEDEYVPKTRKTAKSKGKAKQSISAKTISTTKTTKPSPSTNLTSKIDARLPDIPEEDEENISDYDGRRKIHYDGATTTSKSSSLVKKSTIPDTQPSASKLDAQHKPSKKTSAKGKSHLPPPEMESQPPEAPVKPTRNQSNKRSGKQIDLEDKRLPAKKVPKSTTKKRSAKEAELDEGLPKPPSKIHKKTTTGKNHRNSNTTPETEPFEGARVESQGAKRSKKRPRSPEIDEEVLSDDHTERMTKRKKTDRRKDVGQPKEKENQKSGTTKEAPKPRTKKMTVTEAQHSATKPSKTVKRQEKTAPVSAQHKVTRRGPPKSVLRRLKESQPDILDSEPDPIDFLS